MTGVVPMSRAIKLQEFLLRINLLTITSFQRTKLFYITFYITSVKIFTSLEGTLDPFFLLHQVSTIAMKHDRTTPAANIQNTPAKLLMSRALPLCLVSTDEKRSQCPLCGHHLCFSMSMSPFC